ncbi:sarcosine oxidase subunit delta [Methylobacterium marchantiae]|uniref:Sarcosine oxidase subunit delta n=1 Tax=Methylobacterium marchantiae TaxID=600331 RepID=A0ABW3WUN4_9HYPH|nr:Sarcosine oxidase subunit delta [Methylobacterium marchantiae]
MRIRCPHCGERDNGEFSYLGDAAPVRPDGPNASAEAMHDYVYLRDNPAGLHRELWYHAAGCRSWLVVTRDTRSHEIHEVAPARDVALSRRRGEVA